MFVDSGNTPQAINSGNKAIANLSEATQISTSTYIILYVNIFHGVV